MTFIPSQSTVTIGGVTLLTANLIVLRGAVNHGIPADYSTPRDVRDNTVGYTPSGSKIFRIYAIIVTSFNAAGQMNFGTADDDVGFISNTPPTNLVHPMPDLTYFDTSALAVTDTAGVYNKLYIPFNAIIPNGKYGVFYNNGNGSGEADIYGYEE